MEVQQEASSLDHEMEAPQSIEGSALQVIFLKGDCE
jgi:hypothetical protein